MVDMVTTVHTFWALLRIFILEESTFHDWERSNRPALTDMSFTASLSRFCAATNNNNDDDDKIVITSWCIYWKWLELVQLVIQCPFTWMPSRIDTQTDTHTYVHTKVWNNRGKFSGQNHNLSGQGA